MALTRKFLKAMGIEDEKIDEIIEAHAETVDALKEQRDSFKADAEKLPGVMQELEGLKAKGDDGLKERYNSLENEFNTYKATVEQEKVNGTKRSAYRKLLKDAGVSETALDNILKVTDLKGMELEGDNFKDAGTITESIKKDWAGFIVAEHTEGANPAQPQSNPQKVYTAADIKAMSADDINKNWDAIKASLNGGN